MFMQKLKSTIRVRSVREWSLLLSVVFCGCGLFAQTVPATQSIVTPERIAELELKSPPLRSAADNAWMLVCAALVLMMTGPGLALFYGGLVRKKNVLATMMQSFAMMAVITVLWGLVGYSLCFGSGNSFFGGLQHMFLHGVGAHPIPTTRPPFLCKLLWFTS